MNTTPLVGFIGLDQLSDLVALSIGEEGGVALDIVARLTKAIESTPLTGGTSGLGDDAIATLHYFMGGYDFYLTEKDVGSPKDGPEDFQSQTFGLAAFYGNDPELGYVSLPEILAAGAELDFYYTPKPLSEIRALPRFRRAA